MPKWVNKNELINSVNSTEEELLNVTHTELINIESMNATSKKIIHERYTMIADILTFISDKTKRTNAIKEAAGANNISQQTVRHYLCLYYLVGQ
jgi:response regulator of citrate/malate metabolism